MERTYVYDGAGSGSNDALLLSAMNNGGFGGANGVWPLIYLVAMRSILGNDWGNGGGGRCQLSAIQEQLQTIQGQNSLMSAITGGTSEIRSLANTLNCDVNSVRAGINAVQSAICNVGNQYGMGHAQVINSVQAGNTAIANQIAQCCCDNKLLSTQQGYENRIATTEQTAILGSKMDSGVASVIAKLDAIEDARKDREINSLTAQLATVNARAERAAELAPIYRTLEEIKGKQPNTVPVPWPQLTAIPTAQLYGYPYAGGNGGFL